MEENLHAYLRKEQANLHDLIKLQNKSVRNYFLKQNDDDNNNNNNKNVQRQHHTDEDKLLIVAADLYGSIEHIEVLQMFIDATAAIKLKFAHDFTDLDIDKTDVKMLHDTKKIDYFSIKYNAPSVLQAHPLAYEHFLNQSERFIDTLVLYYNIYHNENCCVDKIVILKSILIKHLCILEYLVGVNK
uniref:DekiORF127 n=1 Tax=Dendrolimus kikuchii nucleopolyhedrovirus TaxID=1219875 RepID=V9LSW5_9ABAC|nr:DekiORF127 [Dendrolimus kikuchii nucleopolyhedrovirus]